MTTIPKERRLPSLVLAGCAAAMPLVLYGLPRFVFQGIYRGQRPPIPVQYWTFVAVIACQFAAYGVGLFCLRMLRTSCPRPATPIGSLFTGITGGTFIVVGGAWCALCAFFLIGITFLPMMWD